MSYIRKLIIKQWLIYFFGAVFILSLILSLGHIINGLMKASNELQFIMLDLLLEMPVFLVKIFPISCLIASLFSINKLKSRNELTAIFASGFSRKQFVITIGISGAIVGLSLFYINGYLVPYSRQEQSKHALTHPAIANKAKTSIVSINALNSGKIWFKGPDYFFSYSSFDGRTQTLFNLSLFFYDNNHKFNRQIQAKRAIFIRDSFWIFKKGFYVSGLESTNFPDVHKFGEKVFRLRESISDFRKINADISTLNIWRLWDYIAVLRTNGINDSEYYVTFLDKFSSGFTCVILAILASIALFNPNRRNSSFGINVSFVLSFTFIYWFIYSYFMTLGQTDRIPAILATFGVPSVFVIYLFFYFLYHRKLR